MQLQIRKFSVPGRSLAHLAHESLIDLCSSGMLQDMLTQSRERGFHRWQMPFGEGSDRSTPIRPPRRRYSHTDAPICTLSNWSG